MLLRADWVLPVSGPPIADGAVCVADGAIEAVGPAAELRARFPGVPERVFPGCALLPGLINSHTHLDYSAFGGFTRPCGFGTWMLRLLLARRKLDGEDFAASALWGAYECTRSGVTSIADASHDGWTVARAARAAGLRARVYLEVFSRDEADVPAAMDRLAAGLERMRGECEVTSGAVRGASPLVEAGLSPHAPYTVPSGLYREAARFARSAGLRMTTHVAESEAEVELLTKGTGAVARAYRVANLWKRQRWTPPGVSPVQYVAETGALGDDMLAVHVVEVDADDIATLATTATGIAHCPRSNRRLRCRTAPVAEMLDAGITVGLGTDSLASNESLDMFAEMRGALQASRARAGATDGSAPAAGPRALSPFDVLRMATLDGARALGLDDLVGSLEEGKRADIIAVGLPQAEADPLVTIVATATADDVRMTMIDGIVVFDGGEMPREIVEGLRVARAKLGLKG